MKLWPGDWEEKVDRMNKKVDEDNGRGGTQENGRFWKLWNFQGTHSGTLGVFCQNLTLALGVRCCGRRIHG